MERFLGITLLILLVLTLLVISRFQQQRRIKFAVGVFAAISCSVLGYHLWENPGAAMALIILAAMLAVELGIGWILSRRNNSGRRGNDATGS